MYPWIRVTMLYRYITKTVWSKIIYILFPCHTMKVYFIGPTLFHYRPCQPSLAAAVVKRIMSEEICHPANVLFYCIFIFFPVSFYIELHLEYLNIPMHSNRFPGKVHDNYHSVEYVSIFYWSQITLLRYYTDDIRLARDSEPCSF